MPGKIKLVLCILILLVIPVNAQYIIEQAEYSIPVTNRMLPPDKKFSNQTEEAKFLLSQPENKLNIDKEKNSNLATRSTIYLDGENFAADNTSAGGEKTSTITNGKKGMFYLVSWPGKTVMEISTKELDQMQKEAASEREETMKRLSREKQEQQEEEQQNAGPAPVSKTDFTGSEKSINGFQCRQYFVEQGDNIMVIWAADDNKGLSAQIEKFTSKMKTLFPSENDQEKDEWELLPGKIPIQVITLSTDMYGSHIDVQEIKKISAQKPPAEKFIPPGKAQGFTVRSMKDMLMQMKSMSGEDEQ